MLCVKSSRLMRDSNGVPERWTAFQTATWKANKGSCLKLPKICCDYLSALNFSAPKSRPSEQARPSRIVFEFRISRQVRPDSTRETIQGRKMLGRKMLGRKIMAVLSSKCSLWAGELIAAWRAVKALGSPSFWLHEIHIIKPQSIIPT